MTAPVIIFDAALWGKRAEVRVEPPRDQYPLRGFADHALAVAHAYQLAAITGWAVRDDHPLVGK